MTGTSRDAPLIGRDAELATLHEAVRDAQSGRAGAVLITGEAGVGKTRLVQALLAGLDTPALRAQCVDLGDPGLPFLAVRDLVRATRVIADPAPAVAGLLASPALTRLLDPVATGVVGDAADGVARPQLLDAVATLLGEVARAHSPAIVLVEDAHWADASSAEFLRFLIGRLGTEPLLVIVTVRTDGIGGRPPARRMLGELTRLPAVTRLDLRPFEPDEVAQYLQGLLGHDAPVNLVDDVRERTGGNAFFLASIAPGLRAGLDLAEVPRALTDVLVGRVEALSEDARVVIRGAAVAGAAVDHRLLAAVTGLADDRLDAALRQAIDDRLFVATPDGYVFVHGLLREAVIGDLLPAQRMRLHLACADALTGGVIGPPVAAEVAHHLLAADDRPAALPWSVRAADDASGVPAPAEALAHFERCLELWPSVADAAARTGTTASDLARRAARAAGFAGEPDHAVELAKRAVGLADGTEGEVAARMELARALVVLDRVDEAVEYAQLAVRAAAGAPALDGPARTVLARALLAARRPDQAREQAELARAGLGGSGDPALEIDLLATCAMIEEIAGHRERAAADLRHALERSVAAGELAAELRVRYLLACLHFYNGDVAGALPVLEDAAVRLADSGLRWSASGVELRILHAVARYVEGDLAGSLDVAATGRTRPPDVAAARLAAVGCYAAVARGDKDAADRFAALRDVWDLDPQVGLVAGGCEADHLAWNGEFDRSAAMAERAQRHLDATAGEGMYGGLWLSALALSAQADRAALARLRRDAATVAAAADTGTVLLERVHRIAGSGYGRPGDLGPEGSAWTARAEAEHARLRGDRGVAEWERAVQAFGFGYAYEQARCRWRLAEALLAAGERDAAREAAFTALTAATEMGATPLRRAVEAMIARSRLDPAAATTPGPLTARELDVLTLVAEGLTNRQIGQRLFISEKTVSVHLSNLMAKLAVSGRTEAVTVAHRRGLLDVAGA